MQKLLSQAGTATGISGITICALAGIARITGQHYVLGYEATTIFSAGTGLMVMACLLRLELLTRRQ